MKQSRFLYFFSIILVFFTISCEIGLGEAVDTKEPQIATKTPPVDAIIRGKFAIGGTWADDGEADKVVVELKRTDGVNAEPISFTEKTVTDTIGKGTWSVVVDPLDKEKSIKDGKYQIVATIFDKAGHSSKEARLITIDNTSPLIVLDRPGTKENTDVKFLDAYGQKLSILGRAADDNEVDSIEINFYNEENSESPIYTVRKDGVSNTIDETVALFRESGAENNQYFDNYDKIYGSEKIGTKLYTCKIRAFDKARKYPESYPYTDNRTDEEKAADNLGNGVDHYYLYKDLSDNLLKDYSVSDLYKMLSGNYVPESQAKVAVGFSIDKVLDTLNSPSVKVEKGKFSLNPENNPYYAASGFSKIDNYGQFDSAKYTVENNGQVFIDMYPGIDGYALYDLPFENHYRVVMYPCSSGADGKIVIDENSPKVISNKNIEVKPQGNGYKLVITLTKEDLGAFANYILRIGGIEKVKDSVTGVESEKYLPFGKDKVGNDFIVKYKEKVKDPVSEVETEKEFGGEGVQYGFRFVPAGAAPKLNVDDIAYNYYKKDSSLTIHGFMDIEDGSPTLTIKLGAREDIVLNLENTEGKNQNSFLKPAAQTNLGYEFKHVFTGINSSDKKVTVTADGGTKYNTIKEMVVNYDEVLPTGDVFLQVKDLWTSSSGQKWYKTSQIIVGAANVVEEGSGIESIKAGIKGEDLSVINKKTKLVGENKTPVEYYEGYVNFPKQGENIISFEIKDKAGNITASDRTVYIDTLAPVFNDVKIVNIDGDSSNTKTKLVNGGADVKVVIEAKDAVSDFIGSDGVSTQIAGSGIKEIRLSNMLGKTDTGIKQTTSNGTADQYTLTISADTIKTVNGSGPVFFEIADNVGNTYTLNGFTMTVDKEAPTVTVNGVVDAYRAGENDKTIDANGVVVLSGTASDNNELASVEVFYKENGTAESTYKTLNAKNTGNLTNWRFEIDTTKSPFSNGKSYNFKVVVKDKAGNSVDSSASSSVIKNGVQTLYVNQDSDRPVVEFTNLTLKSGVNNFDSTKLLGIISDDDIKQELSASYQIVDSLSSVGSTWTTLPLGNGGTWSIELDEKKQGDQFVIFKIKDGNGKEFTSVGSDKVKLKNDENKDISSLSLKLDTISPVINDVYYQIVDSEGCVDRPFVEGQGGWKDFGKFAQETLSGIKNKFLYLKVEASDANGISKFILESKEKGKVGDSAYTFANPVNGNNGKYSAIITNPINIAKDYSDKPNEGEEYKLYPVTLKATDGSGKESLPWTFSLKVDNKAPTLNVDSHEAGDYIRSNFILKGTTTDRDSVIYYQLTTNAAEPSAESWTNAKKYFIDGTENNSSWRIYFDRDNDIEQVAVDASKEMHDLDQKQYFLQLYGNEDGGLSLNEKNAIVNSSGELYRTRKNFYFHFKVEDKLGNTSYNSGFYLDVDPQGDMPVIKLTYPDPKEQNLRVSGIIRLQGESTDDKGQPDLYMQIDPNYDGSNFKPWAYDSNDTNGTNKTHSGNTISYVNKEHSGLYNVVQMDGKGPYYINIGNGLSWTYSLNKFGELNGDKSEIKIAIKLFAKDAEGHFSEGTVPVVLTIDSDAPKLGSSVPFTLNQYGWKDGGGNFIGYTNVEKPTTTANIYLEPGCSGETKGNWQSTYKPSFNKVEVTDGMWLKGEWWLKGSVEDEGGIKSLTINNSDATTGAAEIDKYGYIVNYKVGSSVAESAGTLTYELSALDNQDKNSTKTFTINYDNKVSRINDSNKDMSVVNKNGFFTLASESIEGSGESGFERAVFFFTDNSKNIYDTYLKKSSSANGNKQSYDSLVNEDGLYWHKFDGKVSGLNITIPSNKNVHVGGLLKINGAYYTVKTKDSAGTTITVSPKLPEGTSNVTVLSAIGHVVDHVGAESKGTKFTVDSDEYYGYYSDLPGDDDGDRMIESVSTIGTSTTWAGSINSNNLPDGPININYVVFDKAGNVSKLKTVSAKVKNNAPRIASVSVWNDHNGNKTFNAADGSDEGELQTFYNNGKTRQIGGQSVKRATEATEKFVVSGNRRDAQNGGSAVMTVKDGFRIVPEIVGGNGNLWYSSNISFVGTNRQSQEIKNGDTTPIALVDANQHQMKGFAHGIDEVVDGEGYLLEDGEHSEYVEGRKEGSVEVPVTGVLDKIGQCSVQKPAWFNYTIYDSTGTQNESKYDSTNSLSATFNLALNVQYNDTEAPNVKINPLYWNDEDDNSLVKDSDGNFIGHIELVEEGWNWADKLGTGAKAELVDNDPKVSGWISITGETDDNIQLKELYVKFPGINAGTDGYTLGASYEKGTWIGKSEENKWNFSAEDISHTKVVNSKTESWHTVKWTFNVNTAIIPKVADVNQLFYIKAKDFRGTSGNVIGLETESKNIPHLQMDVVPYITGVNTSLSSLKKNNPSVYGRTAKGHYPVAFDETVTIVGFNLTGAEYVKSSGNITLSEGKVDNCVAAFKKGGAFVQLPVSNLDTSCAVDLVVNGIKTFNNINNNDAKGSAKGDDGTEITLSHNNYKKYAYNRQPNGDNNNLLTDDVYFDVWAFNDVATVKESGYIVEPIMKINPVSDKVDFAYNNGPRYFSMANETDKESNSYALWQMNYARNTTTGFTIDSKGFTHGITVGIDTNPNHNHAGRMTYMYSGWGRGAYNDPEGNYNGTNTSRIESIGAPDSNGNFVFLEDRFKSPSLATVVHNESGVDHTYVYLAYYDDLNEQIRFRWGDNTDVKAITGETGNGRSFGQFVDQRSSGVLDIENKNDWGISLGTYHADNIGFESKPDNYSVVADGNTAAKAGEYVSIAVVPGDSKEKDVVVITWYDSTAQAWMYSYKENPNGDNDFATTGSTGGTWATPVTLKENAGQYCKIAVDGKKGIHIAAQDSFNSDLDYVYLPSYKSTSNAAASVVTVDAAGLTGSNITLDVAIKGNYIIPYIGYYADAIGKPKVAYLPDTIPVTGTVTVPAGDIDESFTGKWECAVIPTKNNVREDYINVGVWKDNSGTWKAASTSSETGKITTGTNSGDVDTGSCYGNGTQNPILGYAIKVGAKGHLETAQMK